MLSISIWLFHISGKNIVAVLYDVEKFTFVNTVPEAIPVKVKSFDIVEPVILIPSPAVSSSCFKFIASITLTPPTTISLSQAISLTFTVETLAVEVLEVETFNKLQFIVDVFIAPLTFKSLKTSKSPSEVHFPQETLFIEKIIIFSLPQFTVVFPKLFWKIINSSFPISLLAMPKPLPVPKDPNIPLPNLFVTLTLSITLIEPSVSILHLVVLFILK